MSWTRRRSWALLSPGLLVAGLACLTLTAGPALADGYCGHDPSGPTACPIPTSQTVTGTFTKPYESDFFVFFARKGTQLSLTIRDTEDPSCYDLSAPTAPCADAEVQLFDAHGHELAYSGLSTVVNFVPVSASLSHTVHANGVYYAVAYNDTAFAHSYPYSLTAFGSLNVTWPHPCVVPKLRRHSDLGTAKRRLTLSRCSVGRVKRVPSRAPRGEVVRLAPGAGTIAAPGARVAIVVSRGSR